MTELVSILGVHLFTISDFFYSIERPFERSQNTLQFKESNCFHLENMVVTFKK